MKNKVKEITSLFESDSAALILSPQNRFYFTGVSSSDGAVLITKENVFLLVDFRYFEMAQKMAKNCTVIMLERLSKQINEILKQEGITSILIESEYVSLSRFLDLKSSINAQLSSSNALDEKIKELRAVKSEEELSFIKSAQEITDKTFSYICERISPGRTEKEVMLDMELYSRKIGSEGAAFDFIVVSGKNSSLPHGVPSEKKIEKSDFVTMDFGATVNGYKSDMTRTVVVGAATDEQINVYKTVLKAQTAAIKAAKAGVSCYDVDKIARDIIYVAGYKGFFGHALGHSVGIDVHEEPTLSPSSKKTLSVGNIVTVEPGIYIPKKYGVRIEDMLYVTENGNIDITQSEKQLIIL